MFHPITLWLRLLYKRSMDLSEFKYENFRIEQLEELVALSLQSYELNNAFSKAGLESQEELEFRVRASVHLFLQAQQKFNQKYKTDRPTIKVLNYRGKLVAAAMAVDLHLFYTDLLAMLDPEDPYIEIFRYLDPNDYTRGTAVFASLIVVKKQYMKHGVGMLLVMKALPELRKYGIKFIIGNSTNPISEKMTLKMGGRVIRQQQLTRNGQTAREVLMIIDVDDMARRVRAKL